MEVMLEKYSWDKNNKIYIRKQEGLYQSTPALFPFITVNWSVDTVLVSNALIFYINSSNYAIIIVSSPI